MEFQHFGCMAYNEHLIHKLLDVLLISFYTFTPLQGVELWKYSQKRSEFYYCNYDSGEASVIIPVISRAKLVVLIS